MGYLKIPNLYKDKTILLFKECYALEKIHGTSAHIKYSNDKLIFFSGGADHASFVNLFNKENLLEVFRSMGYEKVTIFGEAYGGKLLGMRQTYGDLLRFVVFDVQIGNTWLNVSNADFITNKFGLEFVHYNRTDTTEEKLTEMRNSPSMQAKRNLGQDVIKTSEGIVIRPLQEFIRSNGNRVIVKYKNENFSERKSKKDTKLNIDLEVLTKAEQIATEWVTPHRVLEHVAPKIKAELGRELEISDTTKIVRMTAEDVALEAHGEVEWNEQVSKAVKKEAGKIFVNWCKRL